MLKCIVDNAEKTLITNPNLCWFIALVASQVSLDAVSSGETHYCRVGLSRLRSSYKDDPKSCLSSVLAYVEIHYAQVDNSLLHAINHRRVTRLDDASKESTTGGKLKKYPKPEVSRIKKRVAASSYDVC